MALFNPQKEGLAATLSKPGDFLDWEHAFRIQAERLDLQQYLKWKTFLRDKPALPDIRKRKYTKTALAQRTIRSETINSQDTTQESTQDDIQETANGTWVVSDLTEQGQKTFQQDLAFYQLEERIFKDEKKGPWHPQRLGLTNSRSQLHPDLLSATRVDIRMAPQPPCPMRKIRSRRNKRCSKQISNPAEDSSKDHQPSYPVAGKMGRSPGQRAATEGPGDPLLQLVGLRLLQYRIKYPTGLDGCIRNKPTKPYPR
ncbi:hypothetical protein B0T10DRAFT_231493 [Thelonectria olida]|uniref:Uncharacterized protein n=1 Tax=Thelonectria olida TaxID=1576542 RepID=A0A9P8VRA3_9HYPO|nr:hypothetical protein B0T10DRAFT_231493 [Thelonectria olida]